MEALSGNRQNNHAPAAFGGYLAEYQIKHVNTLALPKSRAPKCELSGLAATVALITKDITLYYATVEHASNAWFGIINKIAPLLGPLRSPPPIVGSDEDRAKRNQTVKASKHALVGVCLQEASKFLVEDKPHLAVPGAMQALSFARELFGEASIELTPAYLILAEANLGMGKFQQAEEFLALANWSILNTPNCSNALRSQLHRNFGKLYSGMGRLEDALKELSKDIYYCSLEYGPENVLMATGYYLMGTIFYTQHRAENALAMFDKAVDVWYKFLGGGQPEAQRLGEAQIGEGMEMLKKIHNTREKLLGGTHIATGEAKYIMGLLFLYVGDKAKAKGLFETAHAIYRDQLGAEHPSTADLNRLLQDVRTALEIHAFDSDGGDEELGPDSIEARFPSVLPSAGRNSPIPSPPGSRGVKAGGAPF